MFYWDYVFGLWPDFEDVSKQLPPPWPVPFAFFLRYLPWGLLPEFWRVLRSFPWPVAWSLKMRSIQYETDLRKGGWNVKAHGDKLKMKTWRQMMITWTNSKIFWPYPSNTYFCFWPSSKKHSIKKPCFVYFCFFEILFALLNFFTEIFPLAYGFFPWAVAFYFKCLIFFSDDGLITSWFLPWLCKTTKFTNLKVYYLLRKTF